MMEFPQAATVVCIAFILACWATDLRNRTIPNFLTGSALVAGFALHYSYFGVPGLVAAGWAAGLCAALLAGPFLLGGVGGGDLKMMAAFGALNGPTIGLLGLAAGFALGGVFAVVHLARIGRLGEKLGATGRMLSRAVGERSVSPLRLSDEAPDAVALPYSLPLGAGALAVLVLMRLPQL